MALPRQVLSQLTPPMPEPAIVSLGEAKAQLELDAADTHRDLLIPGWLQAAREWCELGTGRAWLTQAWALTLDRFPDAGAPLVLPKPPLAATPPLVVQYRDRAGALQTWDPAAYTVLRPAGPTCPPATITPIAGAAYPATAPRPDAVTVTYTCGVDDPADLPAAYRTAVLLLLGHWDHHGQAVTGRGLEELPLGVRALLAPYEWVTLV